MAELKNIKMKDFEEESTDSIPYKDKHREEQRLEKLKVRKENAAVYVSISLE